MRVPSSKETRLIFVAGSVRSGTTLLRLILGSHPGILEIGEVDYIADYLQPGWPLASLDGKKAAKIRDQILNDRIFRSTGTVLCESLPIVAMLRHHMQLRVELADVAVGTIHRNFDYFHELFPSAKFIHLIRDPRDVASSAVSLGLAGNVFTGVQLWSEAERSWDRLKSKLPSRCSIEIRYEDFVAQPMENLSRICDFIGIQYHSEMLDLSHTTYSPPDADHAFKWRHFMSSNEVRLIESVSWDFLHDRKYESASKKKPQLSRIECWWLSIDHKFRSFIRSSTKFGFWLTLSERVLRRTGPEWAHIRSMRSIESKMERFLK
jgi:hypothetical protein